LKAQLYNVMREGCADCSCPVTFFKGQAGTCRCGHGVDAHTKFCELPTCGSLAVRNYRCEEHANVLAFPTSSVAGPPFGTYFSPR
jgi:hypothetical protein